MTLSRVLEKVDLGVMHNGFYIDTRNATCTECTLRNWWILQPEVSLNYFVLPHLNDVINNKKCSPNITR